MKIPDKVCEAWIDNGNICFYRYDDSVKYEKIKLPKWVNKAIIAENKRHWEMGGNDLMYRIKSVLQIR
jgi:hypothetical protein